MRLLHRPPGGRDSARRFGRRRPSSSNRRRPWVYGLVAVCLAACGIAPDAQSGGDERRDIAGEVPLDEWVTDENGVNYGGGDKTDWKKIVIPRNGTLFLEVAVDEKAATVDVALFDKYGRLLIQKTRASGTTEHLKFEGEVSKGNYFVRVAARKSEDKSVYSLRASMQGGYGVGDIPPPE